MGSSWNSTGSFRWERWKQVCPTEGEMVRHEGESCGRMTLREPEGVRVKEIWRWGCVTRASEWVRETKKDKPSQGLDKDGEGEGCRKKKMADRMLWEEHIHVAEFKLCNFFSNKYWSLTHEYLKGNLFVSLPFSSNISVISLISHECTKCQNECKKAVIILYWVLKCIKFVAKVYYFFIREKKCACFMHCFSATREQWTYSS